MAKDKAKAGAIEEPSEEKTAKDVPEVRLLSYTDEVESEGEAQSEAAGGESGDGHNHQDDEDNPFPTLNPLFDGMDGGDDGAKKKKPGIIYIGNLPPGIKPKFLKSMMMEHGNIRRFYLEPESEAKRKRRISLGGSGGLRYVEAWVEFETKKEAKEIALLLNGARIGRRKKSRFYDDLWMIKYLKGFKWEMLVEKSIMQRKEREARLRLELSKAKKEDEAFLQSIARAKRQKIAARKAAESELEAEGQDKNEDAKPAWKPKQVAPIEDKTKRGKARSASIHQADYQEDESS